MIRVFANLDKRLITSTRGIMTDDVTKVQLSLKGRNLSNAAGAFKGTSDPYVIVTILGDKESGRKPVVIGKTEV